MGTSVELAGSLADECCPEELSSLVEHAPARMLQTPWSADAWSVVRVEFKRALALQEPDPTRGMLRLARDRTPRRAARPNGLLEVWAAYRTGEGAEMGEEVAAENGARAAVA
jgi:hypothetical protein